MARFLRDAYQELRKAQWPTPEQTARLTGLVVAISVLMAIILGLADLGFDRIFEFITS
jgi:preprotein translocase SecE subunit